MRGALERAIVVGGVASTVGVHGDGCGWLWCDPLLLNIRLDRRGHSWLDRGHEGGRGRLQGGLGEMWGLGEEGGEGLLQLGH